MVTPIAVSSPQVRTEPLLDCAHFDEILSEVLDRDRLPYAARVHMKACRRCAGLLESFEALAARVRSLAAAEPEPASDLWPHIAARLRKEGVIHADAEACRASVPSPKLVTRASAVERR